METIESPGRQFSIDQRRRNRVIAALCALLAAVVVALGLGLASGHVKVNASSTAPIAPVAAKPATQDCKRPGTKVGQLCASASVEHGVTVTRTYITQDFDSDGGLYAYLQDKSVQLNYGDTPTLSNLCVAGAVATTTDEPKEHSYTREYSIMKKEFCDPAQKAKDAGDSDTCFLILNDAFGLAPLVFTPANVDDVCAQPVQPKGKSALVDTGSILNGTAFYNGDTSKLKRHAS